MVGLTHRASTRLNAQEALASLLTPRTTLLIVSPASSQSSLPAQQSKQPNRAAHPNSNVRGDRPSRQREGCTGLRDPLVRQHCATRLTRSDEVYRPIFHGEEEWPKSIVELGYPHAVSTCSMSKAYSLAGLRVGWMASTDPSIVKAAALVSLHAHQSG